MKNVLNLVSLGLMVLLIIVLAVSAPLDGDLWWQMEYGRKILETGSLSTDHTLYSWTKSSNALVYCAWLAQVILFLVYDTAGLLGLNLLRILVLLSPLVLCWYLLRKTDSDMAPWHWCIGFLTFYVSKYAGGMLKPELLGYLCFTLLVFLYIRVKIEPIDSDRTFEIYAIPLLIVLWVNTHGTFTLAGGFLFIVLICELLNSKFSSSISLNSSQWTAVKRIIPLTALAIFINPYTWEWPYQIVSNILSPANETHFKSVFAYQSIFREQIAHLHIKEVFIVLCVIAGALFVESIKERQFDFSLFALNLFFLSMANGWGRASYFSPILLLFTIVYLSSKSPFIARQNQSPNRLVQSISIAFVLSVSFYAAKKSEEAIMGDQKGNYMFAGFLNPQDSADFYEKHLKGNRFCNGYNGGGYLIWRFRTEDKVMLDPRYFPYVDWYSKWVEMKEGTRIKEHMESLNCTVWILGHHYSKIGNYLANSEQWKMVFVGRSAAVFVKSDLDGWKDRELELEPGLGETSSMTQTARIMNALLREHKLDLALELTDQARVYWKDTLNEGRSQRAYEFALGTKYFGEKKDLLAHQYLESAHREPAAITNIKRLRTSRVFASQILWQKKEYVRAYRIARLALESEKENPMLQFNAAFLRLHVNPVSEEDIDWKALFEKMLATEAENKLGIPKPYFDHARKMLETGTPINVAPLKYTDKR